jgi:CRP-like cAMP-binding protein
MADQRTLIQMLGRVPLFQGLSRKQLTSVLRTAGEVDHPAGKEVVREGASGVGFHLILSGTATVTQGRRTLSRLGPGDSFGDIAIIDGGPRSATVRADEPLRTLSLTAWHFKAVLVEQPTIAHKIMLELCRRLREAEKRPPI